MSRRMDREPIGVVGQITGWIVSVAAAIIGVLVAFGVNLTEAQTNAILALIPLLVGPLVGFLVWRIARAHTFSRETVARMMGATNKALKRDDGLTTVGILLLVLALAVVAVVLLGYVPYWLLILAVVLVVIVIFV